MRNYLLPAFLVAIDIICVIVSSLLAVFIRFEGHLPIEYVTMITAQLPILIVLRLFFLKLFHLYNRAWRYAGVREAISIFLAVLLSSVVWVGFDYAVNALIPRSIQSIASILMLVFVAVSRMSLRIYGDVSATPGFVAYVKSKERNNVLIVGAGDAGATIARELQQYHAGNSKLIGFIDDDEFKLKRSMFGVKVLGNRNSIARIVDEYDVKQIIIAMPSIKGKSVRDIVDICRQTECDLKIVPGIYELLEGNVSLGQMRAIQVEDLLGRDPIRLDVEAVSQYINNKVILVTGAGGSIGSEICRQVAKMGPRKILLLGKGENSIYEINSELNYLYPELKKVPIIADIRDRERIRGIMAYFHPQIVFHAAAHKHVPLMEYQPVEAIRNNILGTKVVAEEADRINAEAFVMISTDKAVNPTSVMGCTKRVAEMFVQSMNAVSKSTRYVAVRFGNVLGSRGSVIPLFKKQIERGGPVTVTHPDMKRYFMTIPEASQLVLQAGAMAKGGEVFVLDMGEPVKIVDLAKDMITLSGHIPDVDIKIQYTGLRPGEKLFEELLSAEDGTEKTNHKKIFMAKIKSVDKNIMDQHIARLLEKKNDDDVVVELKNIVPTYAPNRMEDQ